MIKNKNIMRNLKKVELDIRNACKLAKVSEKNINLVAVSKTLVKIKFRKQ